MANGLMEGKVARDYDQRVKSTERTKIYNKFILENTQSNSINSVYNLLNH